MMMIISTPTAHAADLLSGSLASWLPDSVFCRPKMHRTVATELSTQVPDPGPKIHPPYYKARALKL